MMQIYILLFIKWLNFFTFVKNKLMRKTAATYSFTVFLLLLFFITSCSTTKVIPEGQYRLVENKVTVMNHDKYPKYKVSDIKPYILQKPNSYYIWNWNPFLYVYNWENGKGKTWDKLVHKIGTKPIVLNMDQVDDSRENMLNHLQYEGYYYSIIEDSIAGENKKAKVYYEITLGKQYPIHKINYEIRDSVIRRIYMDDLENHLIKEGEVLSESLLEKESERAAELFRNKGFYNFSKNYFFFTADTSFVKDKAVLDIEIRNYTRNENPSDARPHTQFRIGNIYVYPVSDVIRYRAALNKKGLQVLDTLKYKNITILYDKELKIRKSVLNNMNQLRSGELYSEDMVNKTYQRFTNLKLYNSINIEMNQVDSSIVDCNIKLIPSKLQGYKLDFEFSTNSTGLLGFSPSISYYNRNIFRGGEWLNLSLMGNFQVSAKDKNVNATEFGVNAGLSFPTFLFIPEQRLKNDSPRTEINLSYNYQQRPEYLRNMIGANFGYSWANARKTWYFQVYPLQLNIVNMSNESAGFLESLKDPFIMDTYKDHFDFGAGTVISYYTDSSPNPEFTNFKARFSFDIAGNLLSAFNKFMPVDKNNFHTIWGAPYSQYVRAEASVTQTFKFGKDNLQAVAMRFLAGAGYAYGNSISLPFERQLWAGGANSLRGWTARSVGPGSAKPSGIFSIPNQTGDIKLEANLEYRFPLFWLLRGAVFFDAGNVWQIDRRTAEQKKEDLTEEPNMGYFDKNFYKSIAFNTGLGLRVDIKFVVIRFDWGIKLYTPDEQRWLNVREWFKGKGSAFQFAIGYPF